jgi:hypothetical protein
MPTTSLRVKMLTIKIRKLKPITRKPVGISTWISLPCKL